LFLEKTRTTSQQVVRRLIDIKERHVSPASVS